MEWGVIFDYILYCFLLIITVWIVHIVRLGGRSVRTLHFDLLELGKILSNDISDIIRILPESAHQKYHEQQELLQWRLLRFLQEIIKNYSEDERICACEEKELNEAKEVLEDKKYHYHFCTGLFFEKSVNSKLETQWRIDFKTVRLCTYKENEDNSECIEFDVIPYDIANNLIKLHRAAKFFSVRFCDLCH